LSTERKVALIHHLVDAGFRHVEVGSFVHPQWIPQMADTGDVLRRVERRADAPDRRTDTPSRPAPERRKTKPAA
ncbi:MAG: hypothetical protein R3290_10630, partial [Acidimicrobiia bacterium]|nr:hypothetical protein [Acidimicrobiia bacterium]